MDWHHDDTNPTNPFNPETVSDYRERSIKVMTCFMLIRIYVKNGLVGFC